MPRNKRRLDQFLQTKTKHQEVVLAEKTDLANRIFRLTVWTMITLITALLAVPAEWPSRVPYAVGIAVLLLILSFLACMHATRIEPGGLDRPAGFNKFVFVVAAALALHYFVRTLGWSPFLLPVPLFVMVVTIAYGPPTALFFALAFCLFSGLTSPRVLDWAVVESVGPDQRSTLSPQSFPFDVPLALSLLAGALAATLGMMRVRKQSKPVIVGFFVGLVQAAVLLATSAMLRGFRVEDLRDPVAFRPFIADGAWAFGGGLIAGSVVTCLLPAIEQFFGVVTDRRLLDLADPSHDLLRVLRERAPGTYQHTLVVAQLASDAAEAIGANRLLAQVGAYYHDIGKIFKPEYFVENMGEDKSIHDRLRPNMSKMVIISHVKDGIDLAREAKLPERIVDMIPMHHGTTLVEYFFRKARRESGQIEEAPEESEYRYPGSKPRFKEAGILMLADMIEAIAKTEAEPNPVRFRSMVHDQILKRLLDGQLDESDLTLNDLRLIEESFVRTLTNMYHHRIKYPEPELAKKVRGEAEAAPPPEGAAKVGS